MASRSCKHPDIRKFDGIRCCLACGEAVLETKFEGALRPQVGSSSASKPYEYTDLNYQLGQEIRLCILLPGEPQDPLCCELVHVNLDDDPVYDAVSYTWANEDGDASLSSTIHCRGEGFLPITVNCDAVLRQLRRFGSKRRLWIDAICINQSKISERNHQVAFMYSVYSRAQYVRICIVEMPKHYRSRTLSYADLFNRVREDGFSSSLENLRMIWHIISDSIYFSRVWVIQEVASARATYLHFMDESLLLTSTVLKNLSSLSGLPVPLQWDLGQQGGSNIMNCLRAGLQSLSSDPRDKVFAVLSLMYPATRSLIPLDYGLDSATICSYCLTAIIIEQQSLHFATYIAGNSWNEELQSSCLDMNLFKLFVCNNRSRRWIPPTHTFKNISKHARKLWRSKISVQIVNILEQVVLPPTLDDSSYVLLYSSTCPPAVPDMISMPRMRTRSHFIDLIVDTPTYFDSHEGKPQIHDFCFSYGIDSTEPIKCFLWMRPFFRKSREDSADDGSHPDVFGEHDRYWQHRYPDVSLADMSSFLVGPNPASNMIITTRNTVGYTDTCKHVHTRNDFRQGDEVWAIDSLDIPLILRKLEDHVYRILGSCRLWAALELDYWNPGTKKGRWRDESLGPPEEQTRVIEIR